MGGEMSGRRSTRSWPYENRPSTHKAAMTMVAKTGLWMDTRVNHMGGSRRRGCTARGADPRAAGGSGLAGAGRLGRRRGGRAAGRALRHQLGGGAFLEVVEARGEHLGIAGQAVEDLDAALAHVLAAGDDQAAHQRVL